VAELISPLPRLPGCFQDPIHGPHRAVVDSVFGQRGVDLLGSAVNEAFRVKKVENDALFVFASGPRRLLP